MIRNFYHPNNSLAASLEHIKEDQYRVTIWRLYIPLNCFKTSQSRPILTFEEILSKKEAMQALEEFLEHDQELADHNDGEHELDFGGDG